MVIPILGLFRATSSAPEFSASYEFFPLKENAFRLVYREDVDGFGYQSDKETVIADVNGKIERRVKFPFNRRAISESKEMGVRVREASLRRVSIARTAFSIRFFRHSVKAKLRSLVAVACTMWRAIIGVTCP